MPGIVPREWDVTEVTIVETIRQHPDWTDQQVVEAVEHEVWADATQVALVRAKQASR
jgi:hypothetical protein